MVSKDKSAKQRLMENLDKDLSRSGHDDLPKKTPNSSIKGAFSKFSGKVKKFGSSASGAANKVAEKYTQAYDTMDNYAQKVDDINKGVRPLFEEKKSKKKDNKNQSERVHIKDVIEDEEEDEDSTPKKEKRFGKFKKGIKEFAGSTKQVIGEIGSINKGDNDLSDDDIDIDFDDEEEGEDEDKYEAKLDKYEESLKHRKREVELKKKEQYINKREYNIKQGLRHDIERDRLDQEEKERELRERRLESALEEAKFQRTAGQTNREITMENLESDDEAVMGQGEIVDKRVDAMGRNTMDVIRSPYPKKEYQSPESITVDDLHASEMDLLYIGGNRDRIYSQPTQPQAPLNSQIEDILGSRVSRDNRNTNAPIRDFNAEINDIIGINRRSPAPNYPERRSQKQRRSQPQKPQRNVNDEINSILFSGSNRNQSQQPSRSSRSPRQTPQTPSPLPTYRQITDEALDLLGCGRSSPSPAAKKTTTPQKKKKTPVKKTTPKKTPAKKTPKNQGRSTPYRKSPAKKTPKKK